MPTTVPAGAVPSIMAGCVGGIYKNDLVGGGTFTVPTWVEQLVVKDVKPAFPWDMVAALSRETPIKLYAKTQIDMTVQVVMRTDVANADYNFWVNTAFSRINIMELLVLNGKITTLGALGMRGEFFISMDEEAQEIEGVIYTTFSCKPTRTINGVPRWAIIGVGPTPVYTAITYTT